MRAALIPMKELSQAKMRLADVLERRQRAELALAMLTDVITACHDSGCFDMVTVCSSDSEVFWHARELGARPIAEPATLQRPAGVQALNDRLPLERIAFDVDSPEDLDALATLPAGAATRGWLEAHAHYARSQ